MRSSAASRSARWSCRGRGRPWSGPRRALLHARDVLDAAVVQRDGQGHRDVRVRRVEDDEERTAAIAVAVAVAVARGVIVAAAAASEEGVDVEDGVKALSVSAAVEVHDVAREEGAVLKVEPFHPCWASEAIVERRVRVDQSQGVGK